MSTTWWPVYVWGASAESLVEVLTKGARGVVLGAVHERKYEHQGQQRSSFDVKARTVAVVPRSGAARSSAPPPPPASDPWATAAVGAGDEVAPW